jgi:DNA-directed RNA polymerase specialized sigma24 family protein
MEGRQMTYNQVFDRRWLVVLNDSDGHDDRPFAARLLAKDAAALKTFVGRYDDLLDFGFGTMTSRLAQSHPPGCQQPFIRLADHVGNRAGAGYLPQMELTLDAHVARLVLTDLFLVSAGLKQDNSAATCILEDSQSVAEFVARKFYDPCKGRILEDGPGQLWLSPAETEPGEDPVPRLAAYNGISTLRSWMFTMMYNMGRDCVRRGGSVCGRGGQQDDQDGGFQLDPPAPYEMTPAEVRKAREHLTRLQATLNAKLTSWKSGNIRRYQVAYLWLQCGLRNADIADALSISRSAVSQQMPTIRQELLEAARPECEEIARTIHEDVGQDQQSMMTAADVERLLDKVLDEDPGFFFDQVLYKLVLEGYRRLLQQAPNCIAWPAWSGKRGGRRAVARTDGMLVEADRAVDKRDLECWRQSTTASVAQQLASDCGIAADRLHEPVGRLMIEWFCGVTPDALAIQGADKTAAQSARRAES